MAAIHPAQDASNSGTQEQCARLTRSRCFSLFFSSPSPLLSPLFSHTNTARSFYSSVFPAKHAAICFQVFN